MCVCVYVRYSFPNNLKSFPNHTYTDAHTHTNTIPCASRLILRNHVATQCIISTSFFLLLYDGRSLLCRFPCILMFSTKTILLPVLFDPPLIHHSYHICLTMFPLLGVKTFCGCSYFNRAFYVALAALSHTPRGTVFERCNG